MAELLGRMTQGIAGQTPRVGVSKHSLDWERIDRIGDAITRRLEKLGDRIQLGSWYLNPRYSVWSESGTADFFAEALEARNKWLLQARQALSNRGFRDQARQAEREGILVGLLGLTRVDYETDPEDPRIPGATNLSDLSPGQRREVLASAHLSRQLTAGGVMFIDGELIDPRAWQARADALMAPGDPRSISWHRRHCDLGEFLKAGIPSSAMAISLDELRRHLAANPSCALFVVPDSTVVARVPSPAFLEKVEKVEKCWFMRMQRLVPVARRKRMHSADLATKLLFWHGALVIDDECYLPGFRPYLAIKQKRLKKTPFNTPTVPLSYLAPDLGLHLAHRAIGNSALPTTGRQGDAGIDCGSAAIGQDLEKVSPPLVL